MPKLTQELVDEIIRLPVTAEVVYPDRDFPEFLLRVTPDCASYIVHCELDGVRRTVVLGRCTELSTELARRQAQSIVAAIRSQTLPEFGGDRTQSSELTLQDVLETYLAVRTLRRSTVAIYRHTMQRCLGDWLSMPITSISKNMVETRHRELCRTTFMGTTGKGDANHSMKILRALFNFAMHYYEKTDGSPLVLTNPVHRLSQNKCWYRLPPRQTIIPDHKLSDWFKAVMTLKNRTAADYFLFVLLTGLRRTEAATLRWSDIDFESRTLTIRAEMSKNHREHRLPLVNFVYKLLTRRQNVRGMSNYVFPGHHGRGRITDLRPSLKVVREKCGCHVMMHDLRRTFLTMAERLDVPHYALKKLANHVSGSDVTFGYMIIDVERLRPHMVRITDQFLALLFPDAQNF